jgi:hypothetical protein
LVILYRNSLARPLEATLIDLVCLSLAAVAMVVSFCIAGLNITEPDFRSHFHWPLFAAGLTAAVALFLKCLAKSK